MAHAGRKNADDVLLVQLAAGSTVAAAAKKAGLSPRTAQRRLADADFRQRLREARADMVQRALGKLADGSTEAADALRKLLKAKAETVRLGAARAILELGNRLRENVDLEERLAELEQRLARKDAHDPGEPLETS